jgi:predicted amidohydrolase YtcJ
MRIVGLAWTGSNRARRVLLTIEGERIAALDEQPSRIPDGALVLPETALLLPGFHDAHVHFLFGGLQLGWCNFAEAHSTDQFRDILAAYLKTPSPGGGWILGLGLDESQVRISRHDIDLVCRDLPVFIWTHDLHSAAVNTKALELASVNDETGDPHGGGLDRDEHGHLTGMLRANATNLVERVIPATDAAEARAALLRAQQLALSLGITAVSSSVQLNFVPHYHSFADSSDRKIRLNIWQVNNHFDAAQNRFARIERTGFRSATLKGFLDGALGSRSAAFFEPYSDDARNSGISIVREGALARFVRAAHHENYQVALHAIGDRANAIGLDAIEMASTDGRGPEFRPRIEHAQHLREKDIRRFAELGVIASMQPIHCTADMRVVESRLGAPRAKTSYAWRSLLNAGAILAFGSDWPVETLNPLSGIYAAVTRQDGEGNPPEGWQPQERLTVEEALRAYTLGSAYAAYWEQDMGAPAPGKLADFVVLSKDITSCPPREILKARVLLTVVGGEIVYDAMNASE